MNIEKITQGKNLTDTEQTVLEYILDHLDTVQTEGVRGVARANYTSTSTIMRLARKMNYSGFVDMCYKLRSLVETPRQTMQEEEDFLNGFSTQSLLNYNTYTQLKVCAEKLLEQRDKMIFVDTNLRLAVDVSQMVGIRFGETIKAHVAKYGNASRLTAIPLGIAGWLRYMLAVDDEGRDYELAPDPMNEELQEQLGDIVVGKPETLKDQLKPVLSNERLFFTDLYKARVGEKVEEMFREMIAGKGAVKATLHKYIQK